MPVPKPPSIPAVAPSSLVYLFGDRFVEGNTAFAMGERLPCTETKVPKKELTETMFLAAFATLVQSGRLTLTLGQKKTLIFKTNAVFATIKQHEAQDPGGLESRLIRALTGNPQKDSVEELVWRTVGETSMDPWGEVIGQVKQYLLQLGLFKKVEASAGLAGLLPVQNLVPQCERIAPLQDQVPAVQALLEWFRANNPALYRQLREDIRKGINSRYEAPQVDLD